MATLGFATFLILFNALINNYRIIFSSSFSFLLTLSLVRGTLSSINIISLLLLVLMSLLAGIVLSMTIFLVKRQATAKVGMSSLSILAGVIAPACPSCAIGLLSVLGVGSFLAILPFKGLELGVIAVFALFISILYLSKKIAAKVCDVR